MLNFRYECTNLRTNLIFDHYLTTTEIFSNTQIRIYIPVHFAFFNVIIDIRKPPKESSLGGFGAPDWIRTSGLQSRSYQDVKEETQVLCGLRVYRTKLEPVCKNRGSHWYAWAPMVFPVFGK